MHPTSTHHTTSKPSIEQIEYSTADRFTSWNYTLQPCCLLHMSDFFFFFLLFFFFFWSQKKICCFFAAARRA